MSLASFLCRNSDFLFNCFFFSCLEHEYRVIYTTFGYVLLLIEQNFQKLKTNVKLESYISVFFSIFFFNFF